MGNALKRMETWRKRILQFVFPAEFDAWLAVLRLGLGLQVMLYALSLRNDWNYLLTGTGEDVRRLIRSFSDSGVASFSFICASSIFSAVLRNALAADGGTVRICGAH